MKYLWIITTLVILPLEAYSVSKPKNSVQGSKLDLTRSQVNKEYSKAKVRIGVKLTTFAKFNIMDKAGKNTVKIMRDDEIKRTLRAKIDRPNHFIINEYHVETVPLKWVRQTMKYAVRLVFSKRYGEYGEVEEHIGSVDLAGHLEGKDGLYVLKGATAKTFKSDTGDPILRAVIGFGKVKTTKPALSRKSPAGGAELQKQPNGARSSFSPRRKSTVVK